MMVKNVLLVGSVVLLTLGCTQKRTVPEGFQPNYSRFVGYKEDVLTRAVGRPDSIYYDEYGRRYMVYNTFSMDNSGPRFGSYRCRTMFLTGRGMVKASFFNEEECIRER